MSVRKPKLHEGLTLKVNQNGPCDREEAMETVTEKLHKQKTFEANHEDIEILPRSARLLNIPAEIRNKIWRMNLIYAPWGENNHTRVNQFAHWEPRLLRTCRQIRAEGKYIYYCGNRFRLRIRNLVPAPQPSHWVWSKVPKHHLDQRLSGGKSWTNLKYWLQRYSEGGPARITSRYKPLSKAFDIVEAMRDVPWSTIEVVLEAYKECLEAKTQEGRDWVFDN